MARPLPLITCTDGQFAVGAEAAALLSGLHGPVGVAAVAGRARQGKSYILNELYRRASGASGPASAAGFAVSGSHRPCTKGLWLWSAPIARVAADGTSYSLLLVDTEGIDAYDQTGQYSTAIFSLAVLLSSLLVYNHLGGIDEAALDRLGLVAEVSKLLALPPGDAGGGGTGHGYTPSFLWLLRDFYLDLSSAAGDDGGGGGGGGGGALTPSDYLELALRPVPVPASGGAGAASKNAVRAAIRSLFPSRCAAALVRPVTDEAALQSLGAGGGGGGGGGPAPRLRPEFVAGVDALTATVLERAGPKRLGGDPVTGAALAALAAAYCAALNSGAVPPVASAWEGVAAAECGRARDAAAAAYDDDAAAAAAAGGGGDEESAAAAAHAAGAASALAAFDRRAVGPAPLRAAARGALAAELARRGAAAAAAAAAAASAGAAAACAAEASALAAHPAAPAAALAAAVDAAAARLLAARPIAAAAAGGGGSASRAAAAPLVAFLRSQLQSQLPRAASAAAAAAAAAARSDAEAAAAAAAAAAAGREARLAVEAADARAALRLADAAAAAARAERDGASAELLAVKSAAGAATAEATAALAAARADKDAAVRSAAGAEMRAAAREAAAEAAERAVAAAAAAREGAAAAAAADADAAADAAGGSKRARAGAEASPAAPPAAAAGPSGRVLPPIPTMAAAAAGGGAGWRGPAAAEAPRLSVALLRSALCDNGLAALAAALDARPGGARKADWVAAYQENAGRAGVYASRRG